MKTDFLIVGSGLTGATLARLLTDAGFAAAVVERRSHWGGNVHDFQHPSGIRIHSYGPHYFRTSSDTVWAFVNRFAAFYPFEAVVLSQVDGLLEHWPVAASYIRREVGPGWTPEFQGKATDFEQAALSLMPRVVYEKFVKEYTEKQWGVSAHTLSPQLCNRFEIRHNEDARLTPDAKYQGLPIGGYTEMTRRMLEDIPLLLNYDYLKHQKEINYSRKLIYTGPIDTFFDYNLGRLAYRRQIREHQYLSAVTFGQAAVQVNEPQHAAGRHIRTVEWKRMLEPRYSERITGTVLTTETPCSAEDPDQYEYPFPDEKNTQLYRRYLTQASQLPDVLFCGRLGLYQYLDMDKAIGQAMRLAEDLIRTTPR